VAIKSQSPYTSMHGKLTTKICFHNCHLSVIWAQFHAHEAQSAPKDKELIQSFGKKKLFVSNIYGLHLPRA
jgi:hypothetical protein